MCVFAVPISFLFFFFPQALVLINDISLVSRCFLFVLEMRTILFLFLLPFCCCYCCMHLYFMFTAVSYQMFFH